MAPTPKADASLVCPLPMLHISTTPAKTQPEDPFAVGIPFVEMASRITLEMIEAARAKEQHRLDEQQDLDHDELEGGYTVASVDEIVIACGVTADELQLVPDEWIGGDRLALRPDGRLVFESVMAREVEQARAVIFNACQTFASEHRGLQAELRWSVNIGQGGSKTPEVTVLEPVEGGRGSGVPRVIIEIVKGSRTGHRYVDTAIDYLRGNPDVVRVIVFKSFPLLSSTADEWEAPAMAIVFGLADPDDRGSRVQIFETRSFGNVGVCDQVADTLNGAVVIPDLEPLEDAPSDQLLEPGVNLPLNRANFARDLTAIRDQPQLWDVNIPVFGVMRFGLSNVFASAMEGRLNDENVSRVRQAGLRRTARSNSRAARVARREARDRVTANVDAWAQDLFG